MLAETLDRPGLGDADDVDFGRELNAERNNPDRRQEPDFIYTAFCADAHVIETVWIQAVTAASVEEARQVAISECSRAWRCATNDVQCIGIAEGDVNILFWDDN